MSSNRDQQEAGGELNFSLEPETSEKSAGAEVLILNPAGSGNRANGETVLIELEDLLPDASGEVVLFADDDLPVNIVTDLPVTDAGISETHVTAAGVDVSGLHFYSFESGLTVYSPTDVMIVADSGVS